MASDPADRRRTPRRGGGGGAQRRTGDAGAQRRAGDGATPRRAADQSTPRLPPELTRALARMPETQRRVLELRMGLADGHPHDAADAARAMGVSPAELREIEARAFERLRAVLPREHLQRLLQGG